MGRAARGSSRTSPENRRWRSWAAIAVVVGVAAAGCGDDDGSTTTDGSVTPTTSAAATVPPSTTPETTTATTAATETTRPGTTVPAAAAFVNVYWGWSIPTSYGTPERLGAGGRTVTVSDTGGGPDRIEELAASAFDELLAGPDAVESEIGMLTAIPDGTRLLGVELADGGATVDLSSEFTEPGGTLGESTRLAQVVFTLTAVEGIDRVLIAIDGVVADPVLSEGFVVGDGLERDDFETVRPFILVESPTPGEEVAPVPIVVRGESNSFESNVRWELVDGEGLVVDDGFTTATAGMGTWGEFEFTVDVAGVSGQRAAIIVFESSPEDGSQRNVVEVPIVVS